MRKNVIILIFFISLIGCSIRVALYAPRRDDTEEHREAKNNSECLDCHDIKDKAQHTKKDD